MKDKLYVPPLKIQGIKTKLIPLIKKIVADNTYQTWFEPFLGFGVVGFNIYPKNASFSDTNPYIIDFYNSIKNKIINEIIVQKYLEKEGEKLEKFDDKYYYEVRNRFNDNHNPLDFLFLNRSNFNGMIRFNKNGYYNVPYGHKPKRFTKAYITKICNQIKFIQKGISENNWKFFNVSFEKMLPYISQQDFIYCDPSYIGRHVDYYNSWDEKLEILLKKLLMKTKAKFIVSTWHHNKYRINNYVNTLWNDCKIQKINHFYFVGAKESNRQAIVEALLYNF